MIETIDDLVTFLHHYHAPLGEHESAEDIPPDCPHALEVLYTEFGNLIDSDSRYGRLPFDTQDRLLPPSRLRLIDGMWEFASENQWNWTARCEFGEEDDPPVYSDSADLTNTPARGMTEVCDSLEHFLITLALQEAVMGSPRLYAWDYLPEDAFTTELTPLRLDSVFVFGEPTHDFYTCADGRILVMDYCGLWIGSYADAQIVEQHLKRGDWSRLSDFDGDDDATVREVII